MAQAARHVQGLGADVRLVIDATGFLHREGFAPEKSWRDLDAAHMARAFTVNAVGPALLMKHFLPLLPRQGRSVFATLSARVGSIGDNRLGAGTDIAPRRRRSTSSCTQPPSSLAGAGLPRSVWRSIPVRWLRPCPRPFVKAGLDVQTTEQAADHLLDTI